jgi:hypothetical protein
VNYFTLQADGCPIGLAYPLSLTNLDPDHEIEPPDRVARRLFVLARECLECPHVFFTCVTGRARTWGRTGRGLGVHFRAGTANPPPRPMGSPSVQC